MSVATEMVAELDITDQDVIKIAEMIDGEIVTLVAKWKIGPGIEESPDCTKCKFLSKLCFIWFYFGLCVTKHSRC